VAINYNASADAAEKVAATIKEKYPSVKVFTIQADMATESEVVRLVEEATTELGGLDIIISNAGYTRFSSIPDLHATTADDWDKCYAVNVKAQNYLLRTALPTFHANPQGGALIMTSSIAGSALSGSSLPYCVTKAAQLQIMRVMAASQGPKVRINAVLPGLLLTEWGRKYPQEAIDAINERAALKKETDLWDCAEAFVDIARNSSMTGQKIVVDAGIHI
jgi:NAD(P)-dependent dehydrogenase (short-subunit alcohol dehydrogenase family)